MPANGTANLMRTALKPGQNPRLVLPNHREHGKSLRVQLRKLAEIHGGEINISDTESITLPKELYAWYKVLRDATDDKLSLDERRRAIESFSDRLHGRPTERKKLEHLGKVELSTDGWSLAEIKDEEMPKFEQWLAEGRVLLRENRVVPNPDFIEATFEDE